MGGYDRAMTDPSLPNANSPRLLARLLEMVARGVRSSRGLQEALGVNLRTVQYYLRAGEWLGFLEPGGETRLSPVGLEYVYDVEHRRHTYARAVWANDFVQELMAGRGTELPETTEIARAVARSEPELAAATARRRASAVRSLLEPAMGRRRPRGVDAADQLALPLAPPPRTPQAPTLDLSAGRDHNPDLYRVILGALLDHGELTLGHLRALLDRVGAHEAPLGGYVELALARGDAARIQERLVCTAAATRHAELVESTTSVILSDPGYRDYLAQLLPDQEADRSAEIRLDAARQRYRLWDRRLFGRSADAATLTQDLRSVVMDRSLDAWPLRKAQAVDPVEPIQDAFLLCWEGTGLHLCLPPGLTRLEGGVAAVNALLRRARQGQVTVGVPDLATRTVVFHGGLLHPGEPWPRSIPDSRTLRSRLVLHAPYVSLVVALLLAHRLSPQGLALRSRGGQWVVRRGYGYLGPVLPLLDRFARQRGWVVARRPRGGLGAHALVRALEHVGLAEAAGPYAVLSERFFGQLRAEAEEMELHEHLRGLAEALEEHLMAAEPLDTGA